jgi:hypothetical protein
LLPSIPDKGGGNTMAELGLKEKIGLGFTAIGILVTVSIFLYNRSQAVHEKEEKERQTLNLAYNLGVMYGFGTAFYEITRMETKTGGQDEAYKATGPYFRDVQGLADQLNLQIKDVNAFVATIQPAEDEDKYYKLMKYRIGITHGKRAAEAYSIGYLLAWVKAQSEEAEIDPANKRLLLTRYEAIVSSVNESFSELGIKESFDPKHVTNSFDPKNPDFSSIKIEADYNLQAASRLWSH